MGKRAYDIERYEMPYQTKQERKKGIKRMPRKKYAIVKTAEQVIRELAQDKDDMLDAAGLRD